MRSSYHHSRSRSQLSFASKSVKYVHPLFSSMKVISEDCLKSFGALPSYEAAIENNLLEEYPMIPLERAACLIVFVSHRWLRSHAVLPQPDDEEHSKFKLIFQALEKVKEPIAAENKQVLLWIDFCCIPSNDTSRNTSVLSLPGIIERCDALLYPVLPNNMYSEVALNKWNTSKSRRFVEEICKTMDRSCERVLLDNVHCQEMFSRSWIRLETLLATVIPLGTFNTIWFQYAGSERRDRPLIFATHDSDLAVLPRISRRIMHAFDPSRGDITVASDRALIEQIKSSALATYNFGYSMAASDLTDIALELKEEDETRGKSSSGHVSVNLDDGGKYSGMWKNGVIHGEGIYRYTNGAVFDGNYDNGKPHGRGCFTHPNGKVELQHWQHGVLLEITPMPDYQTGSESQKRQRGSLVNVLHGRRMSERVKHSMHMRDKESCVLQ